MKLVVLALVACGQPHPSAPPRAPHLPPPVAGDPTVRGASYLRALGELFQPRWAQFLEDCRLRLPVGHALNAPTLATVVELAIGKTGKILEERVVVASGNGEFETAVADVIADVQPLPAPPAGLASDDELVHVRWSFARDRRQAGAATAEVLTHALPRGEVVQKLLERGDVTAAARRADAALAEPVMLATLREALASTSTQAKLAAIEAIARGHVVALAPEVRAYLAATNEEELRIASALAAGQLGDRAALLAVDFHQPRLALAELEAMVALGRRAQAAQVIAAALPDPTALAALAIAPVAEPRLAGWFAHGDARTRAAICAGKPDQAIVRRGLADADATVRATCADAATEAARLEPLAADRDQSVRAHAVAALARIAPTRVHAQRDPAAVVRRAAALAASPAELAQLVDDRDADVRAAAVARSPAAAGKAAGDPAPQVRLAAVELADDATLETLARDDSPTVASAAVIAQAQRAGRAAATPHLLDLLAASPPGSDLRVRIALAWLLAR